MRDITRIVESLIGGQENPQTQRALRLADNVGVMLATMGGFKTELEGISVDDYVRGLNSLVGGTLTPHQQLAVQVVAHSVYGDATNNRLVLSLKPNVLELYLKLVRPAADCILAALSREAQLAVAA